MRTITVVYERHHYLYRWLKPLFAAKKEFKELGYEIKYQSLIDYLPVFKGNFQKKLERLSLRRAMQNKYDIVMMAFHHSTSQLCSVFSENERADILKRIKDNCNILIWLDTADSTGTCMFDVMPYVDLYFKKQMLKDISLYCSEMYGSRLFCEFYHRMLGVEDDTITSRTYPILEKKYLPKLRLAWNVGLGDLYATPWQLISHPFSVTKPEFVSPDSEKTLDLQYRGSGYSPIAGYPRSESRRQLLEMKGISYPDVSVKIPKSQYIEEGHSSKSILSPFGWGEICGRDFEAFVYGGCMIKQSMEEIVTYPDAYRPMETYVPLKWDFSDFKERLSKAGSAEYRRIAKRAQEYYEFFFKEEGRRDFARHIVNELERK